MKKVVADASVAIKWFVPEIHSAAATRLLELEIVVCAPDLIFPEFGNILWKKVRRGELTRYEVDEILTAFSALSVEIHPSSALLAGAFELAIELGRTVYDSLYLALAIAHDCVLVTADAKFHSALSASPVANHVHWVEDEI
jgi:predicted nucleic acid-binding protein